MLVEKAKKVDFLIIIEAVSLKEKSVKSGLSDVGVEAEGRKNEI